MRFGLCSTALGALALVAATPVLAQSQAPSVQFRVPAGPLNAALPLFAAQSGEQILYSTDLVAGRQSPGVSGAFTTDQALAALLRGTGLRARRASPNTLVVFDPDARAEITDEATELAEVVVTGSLIRGAGDGPSPVVTVTRDDIDRQGHGTVAQALAALPQNFGGTGNDAAMSNGGDRTGANSFYASGVNLRGLGSDATLVLVNGRRMAGTGNKGDFADVSTIPTSAVARIDVLLDGASALYGADAVGGVVNIILRDDYDGAETRVRYGANTDGASDEFQIAQTFGRRWSSGSILGVYEYNDRSRLAASERDRASDADLRRFGGSDRRRIFSNPGNIVVFNAAAGGYVPTYAIPPGQNGVGLRPGDFLAGQANLYNHREGLNVMPRQTRHSAYLVLNQDLGDRVSLNADVRYGLRDYEAVSQGFPTTFTVTSANPYFVSPTGASSHIIAYNFGPDLGNPKINGRAESLGVSLGAKVDLVGGWRLDTYAAYRNLTPTSRAALIELMQSNAGGVQVPGRGRLPDRHYTSFNIGCLEEDAMPRAHPDDHFINVGRDILSIDSAACPRDGECILSGITRDLAILRDTSRSRADRVFALMAIGHWLGDIHQPLHVSFADDRGGNGIDVPSFRCGGSSYRSDNLHSVWDACILEAGLFNRVRKRADYKSSWGANTITYRAVDTLMANTSLAQERTIIQGDPQAWANESYAITLAPTTLYCVRVGPNCQYSATTAVLRRGAAKRVQTIDAAYLAAHDRVAEDRVRYAGFRLAHLMNQALDPAYTGPVANGAQPT